MCIKADCSPRTRQIFWDIKARQSRMDHTSRWIFFIAIFAVVSRSIAGSTCSESSFQCKKDDHCLPLKYRCDGYADCIDGSDECGCDDHICPEDKGKCNDGTCIPNEYFCDHYNDCKDGEDELSCKETAPTTLPDECSDPDYLKCEDGNGCYPPRWKCDQYKDCNDNSDEQDCPETTTSPDTTNAPTPVPGECSDPDYLKCDDGSGCYPPYWKCDQYKDCADNSDEQDCPETTTSPDATNEPTPVPGECSDPGYLKCDDGSRCYPPNWKCDQYKDCDDNSDEQDCPETTTNPDATNAPTLVPGPTCGEESSRCDGFADCTDGSDETGCDSYTCSAGMVKCGSGDIDNLRCVPTSAFCDGYQDCPDGGDEEQTTCKERTCGADKFKCSTSGACLPIASKCNGYPECPEGEDETVCTTCPKTGDKRCNDKKLCYGVNDQCDGIADCADKSDETGCSAKRGVLLSRLESLLGSLQKRGKRSEHRLPNTLAQRNRKEIRAKNTPKASMRRALVRASVVRTPTQSRHIKSEEERHGPGRKIVRKQETASRRMQERKIQMARSKYEEKKRHVMERRLNVN